jgi:hypothetical protein
MAKRLAIPSKELQLHVVGPRDWFKASRVQRVNLNVDIPSTTIDELGNASHVGDAKDTPNVTLTFSAMDVGIKVFAALTGYDPAAYPGAGVDISLLNEIDAILFVKDASINDYVKTAHAKRLQVRDFTFNYSTDGEAQEDYTAVGSERRWFSNDIAVEVKTGTFTTLAQAPVALKNGNKLLSLKTEVGYLDEVVSAPAANQFSVSGTTITYGAGATPASRLLVVYQVATASPTWADVSDTAAGPAAVRGKDIPIYIAANNIQRVQSVTINGTLNVQPVKEMGNRAIVGYQRQVPEVTGTITVMDTDTELLSLLQYGVTASGTEYAPGEGCVASGVALEVRLLDPCDTTVPYTVLKTVYLDNIVVTGDSYAGTVNQNTTSTFNFKSVTGHCVVYSGSR